MSIFHCPFSIINSLQKLTPAYTTYHEPTSALDGINRQVVVELLAEKKKQGAALIGIYHAREVRDKLCTRELVFEGN